MLRVLSFDPGGTTGYVVAETPDFSLLEVGVVLWKDRFGELKRLLLEEPRADYVVVEGFRLFPHKARALSGSSFPAVQIIGMIEAFHSLSAVVQEGEDVSAIRFQPASCKTLVKIRPEHAHRFTGKHKRHAEDAYKHLRYFLVTYLKQDV